MNKLEEYLALLYSVEVVPDQATDGTPCYLAKHPELPGCMSHGETPEEAISNLSEAKKLYIEILLEKNQEIPAPKMSHQVIWTVLSPPPMTQMPSPWPAINPIHPLEV